MKNKRNYNNISLQELVNKPVELSRMRVNKDENDDHITIDYIDDKYNSTLNFFQWVILPIRNRIFICYIDFICVVYYTWVVILGVFGIMCIAHFTLELYK